MTGIAGAAWIEAAARISAQIGLEIRIRQIGPGCEVGDLFGDWQQNSEVTDSGCVLVRPDAHVGYRCSRLSSSPARELEAAMHQILDSPSRVSEFRWKPPLPLPVMAAR